MRHRTLLRILRRLWVSLLLRLLERRLLRLLERRLLRLLECRLLRLLERRLLRLLECRLLGLLECRLLGLLINRLFGLLRLSSGKRISTRLAECIIVCVLCSAIGTEHIEYPPEKLIDETVVSVLPYHSEAHHSSDVIC